MWSCSMYYKKRVEEKTCGVTHRTFSIVRVNQIAQRVSRMQMMSIMAVSTYNLFIEIGLLTVFYCRVIRVHKLSFNELNTK
jgi:hypothetical protein